MKEKKFEKELKSYMVTYDEKYLFITSSVTDRSMTKIPMDDEKSYSVVDMAYDFLDEIKAKELMEISNEELLKKFIEFINENYKDYEEEI